MPVSKAERPFALQGSRACRRRRGRAMFWRACQPLGDGANNHIALCFAGCTSVLLSQLPPPPTTTTMVSDGSSGPSMKTLKQDLRTAFAGAGLKKVDPDIMSKCMALSTSLQVSPQQMAECWETLSLNRKLEQLTDASFQSFRSELIKVSDVDAPTTMTTSSGAVHPKTTRIKHELPSVTPPAKRTALPRTPEAADPRRVSLSPTVSMPAPPPRPQYGDRKNPGKVEVTYNPQNLPANHPSDASAAARKCRIATDRFAATNVAAPYRHMFTVVDERAKVLNKKITDMTDAFVGTYHLGVTDELPLEAVGTPRQEPICCVGRICNDAHEGRINKSSLILEGAANEGGGARIHLNVAKLTETNNNNNNTGFSLFPGQIVAVEGVDPTGTRLSAHKLIEGAAPPPCQSTVEELTEYHNLQDGKPLRIVTVSGPYTSSDNSTYEPLHDLLDTIRGDQPDVVILTGPFVDVRHPDVRDGNTVLEFESGEPAAVPYETFFANKVAVVLEDYFGGAASNDADGDGGSNAHVQFVLVPSLHDATADAVYPQPPFQEKEENVREIKIPGADGLEVGSLGLKHVENVGRTDTSLRRVHLVSNPCTFQINEVVFGVTSHDVLFNISADETNAKLAPGSRMSRISQNIIQQQSYYPLFPPAADMNLDLKKADQMKMPCQPDVLILPSKLNCFAKKVLDRTLVVNPGHLTRDTTGGTYGILDVHPIPRKTLEDAAPQMALDHVVPERTRVEIRRI